MERWKFFGFCHFDPFSYHIPASAHQGCAVTSSWDMDRLMDMGKNLLMRKGHGRIPAAGVVLCI